MVQNSKNESAVPQERLHGKGVDGDGRRAIGKLSVSNSFGEGKVG